MKAAKRSLSLQWFGGVAFGKRTQRCGLVWCALGWIWASLLTGGCASSGVESTWSEPVPSDVAWVHGSVDLRWAAVFVRRVDGVEQGKWWEPEAPVAIAPGSHRLTIQFDSHYEEERPSGFLDDIEVNLQAGGRYRVRQSVMETPLGQFATKVWVEVADGSRPVSEIVVIWPLAR